jgi:hypothetical protein
MILAFGDMIKLGLLTPPKAGGKHFHKTAKAKAMGEDAFADALEMVFAHHGVGDENVLRHQQRKGN